MYEAINSLKPYFFSLREIEGQVSLDIRVPIRWEYESVINKNEGVSKMIQDSDEKFILLSLVSVGDENGYDSVFNCAGEIILLNREQEEKEKLFKQKINELKKIFLSESLDKLKELNFLEEYGQKTSASDGAIGSGDEEGSKGDRE